MRLVRPRGLSALITLAVGAGVLTGAGVLAAPASADGVAPTGSYALNTTSIWAAQWVQLTETALTDDVDPAASITRVVKWGDGKSEPVLAGTTKLRHKYETVGTFAVSVELTDTDNNTAKGTFAGAAAVTVAATPGTYKLDKTLGYVWTDPEAPEPARREGWAKLTVSLSAIPSRTSRVRINWGDKDKNYSLVARTQKTATWYYQRGTYKVTAAMENSDGQSATRAVGTFKVIEDTTAPTITIKTPKSPTKASSWKSISGTAADKGLGVVAVNVWLWQLRGSTWYYYNFSKKSWVKYKGVEPPNAATKIIKSPTKGAWKVSVSGIKKGTLEVNYAAADGNWNWSAPKRKTQKIK